MKLCLFDRTNKSEKEIYYILFYNKRGGGGQNAKKKRTRKGRSNGGTDVANRTRGEAYGSMF